MRLLLVLAALFVGSFSLPVPTTFAQESEPEQIKGWLTTTTKQRVQGTLFAFGQDIVRWQPDYMTGPVDYRLTDVVGLALDHENRKSRESFLIELEEEQKIYGQIQAVIPAGIIVHSARFGTLSIPADQIVKVQSTLDRAAEDPTAIWTRGDPDDWWALNGRSLGCYEVVDSGLRTWAEGSLIWRDLRLATERELAIEVQPLSESRRLRLYLGVRPDADCMKDGLVIELRGGVVVAYRELERGIDETTIGRVSNSIGSDGIVRLHLQWDPDVGVAHIRMDDAADSVEVTLFDTVHEGLAIEAVGGGLILRDLRSHTPGTSRGAAVSCKWDQIVGFDVARHELLLAGDPIRRVPVGDLHSIRRKTVSRFAVPAVVEPFSRWVFDDGTDLRGEIVGWDDDHVLLETAWATKTVRMTLTGLKRVSFSETRTKAEDRNAAHLTIGFDRHAGQVVGWDATSGGLLWQPSGSVSSSAIRPDVQALLKLRTESDFYAGIRRHPHALCLMNGDRVPGRVIGSTEDSVLFESMLGESQSIAWHQVKAIEIDRRRCKWQLQRPADKKVEVDDDVIFLGGTTLVKPDPKIVDDKRRERVLEMPRGQENQPPTHVLVARSGDVLRGRLLRIVGETVEIDVSSQRTTVALDQLIAVISLREPTADQKPTTRPKKKKKDPVLRRLANFLSGKSNEKQSQAAPQPVEVLTSDFPLQVVLDDQTRLSMNPTDVIDGKLIGRSLFGEEVRIEGSWIRTIYLGGLRKTGALAYPEWVLAPKPESETPTGR